jgi:hypothetical protein
MSSPSPSSSGGDQGPKVKVTSSDGGMARGHASPCNRPCIKWLRV